MTINLHIPTKDETLRPTITVIGVGGAGGNAVNNMITSSLEGVNFVVANTDAQALDHALADRTIQLGATITKGLGAGANPDVGRASAEEAREEVLAHIDGSNMVFITAGMGGGTGTGAAPVVARMAKEQGVLTVAVVTKPFQFEGTHRMKMAEAGLKELQEYVDTLIIIPNQNLFRIANERTTFADAFKMADEVLHSGVRGITDLMVKPGLINLDFADIRTVMREMGKAMMGTGEATGDRRAIEAAEAAISNPLLDDVSLRGARALLINITGGPDMTLFEVDEAANRIREEVDPEANIIFGSTFNDGMEGRMRVSVVATGIDAQTESASVPQKAPGAAEPRKPFAYAALPKTEAAKTAARAYDPPREGPRPFVMPEMPSRVAVELRAGGAQRAEVKVEEKAAEPAMTVASESSMPESVARAAPVLASVGEPHGQAFVRPLSQMTAGVEAVSPHAAASEPRTASAVSPRREPREPLRDEPLTRGFFQIMADMGRAFSSRSETPGKPEVVVQVTQRAPAQDPVEKAVRRQDEGQYLDIPAFLRRQAN